MALPPAGGGNGAQGALSVTGEVQSGADRCDTELLILPTVEAIAILNGKGRAPNASLHLIAESELLSARLSPRAVPPLNRPGFSEGTAPWRMWSRVTTMAQIIGCKSPA